jgi:hypothetical protein
VLPRSRRTKGGISFCDPPEMVSPSQHPITGARALAFDAD